MQKLTIIFGVLSLSFGVAQGFFGKKLSLYLAFASAVIMSLLLGLITSFAIYVFIKLYLPTWGLEYEYGDPFYGWVFLAIWIAPYGLYEFVLVKSGWVSERNILAWYAVLFGAISLIASQVSS